MILGSKRVIEYVQCLTERPEATCSFLGTVVPRTILTMISTDRARSTQELALVSLAESMPGSPEIYSCEEGEDSGSLAGLRC